MYGIIKVTVNADKTGFVRDWVRLPNGDRASYSWRDRAAEMAAGMTREARAEGILGVDYRIKEFHV